MCCSVRVIKKGKIKSFHLTGSSLAPSLLVRRRSEKREAAAVSDRSLPGAGRWWWGAGVCKARTVGELHFWKLPRVRRAIGQLSKCLRVFASFYFYFFQAELFAHDACDCEPNQKYLILLFLWDPSVAAAVLSRVLKHFTVAPWL